jgi:putative tryptophan/tyrosine transport system substrate-binding protein
VIVRRAFLQALSAGLLAVPGRAGAQPAARLWRIGFLCPAALSDARMQGLLDAFRQGLVELGYAEGRSFAIEPRWAEEHYERLPQLAAELVALKVDVIVAVAVPATQAARAATQTIPIVMAAVVDPVATGLVSSLARPGANVTGLSTMAPEVTGKQIEILKEIVPKASVIALLWNPDNPGNVPQLRAAEASSRSLGIRLLAIETRAPEDFDKAFAAMGRGRADALIVLADIMLNKHRARLADLAAAHRLPAAYGQDVLPVGLLTYSVNTADLFRRSASYVDRIFKGAKPGDLPIEQATRFELAINLRAARAIGLTIPQSLLLRADHVIE